MSTKQDVLRLLYSTVDKPLSGQDIAEQLNLSRTAVMESHPAIKKKWLRNPLLQAQRLVINYLRQTDLLTP